jgi:acyl carrier protein
MIGIDSVETKVRELFATILQVSIDNVNVNSTPENTENWDSFQHLVLVSAFEEEFDICIEPEEVAEMYKDYQTFKMIIMQKLR